MSHDDHGTADVCVVGSGASGAIAASVLALAGRKVLLLEEGARLAKDATYAEARAESERAYVRTPEGKWHLVGNPWTVRAFGGGMSWFAGIAFRYREVDFDASSYTATDALDPIWPINYEDLRPYYDQVEQILGVARQPNADPLEPAGAPPPLPPHPYSFRGRLLAEAAVALGLKPFPTPLAINSVKYAGSPRCERLTSCTERQCPVGAKATAIARILEPLEGLSNLHIHTSSKAIHLLQSRPTRVSAVEWIDLETRRSKTTRIRCVVLAANAVQSAALLLRSTSRWAPTGMGNRSDQVGRGLSFKVSGYAAGSIKARGAAVPSGRGTNGMHSTVAFSDYYLDAECPSGLGGMLYEANPVAQDPNDDRLTLRLHFLAGDQPMATNLVRLAKRKSSLGLNLLTLDYTTSTVDSERGDYLASRAEALLRAAKAEDIVRQGSNYQYGSGHLHGTCRAGSDPSTSVVDSDGRVHTLDNVFVVDGGYMPFAGGVNPTLTIQANALRIAQKIVHVC